jgi:hypothetical protein
MISTPSSEKNRSARFPSPHCVSTTASISARLSGLAKVWLNSFSGRPLRMKWMTFARGRATYYEKLGNIMQS